VPYKNKEDEKKHKKQYREDNRERIKEQRHKAYLLNSEKVKERVKQWAKDNSEKIKSYKTKWRENNPEYNGEYYLNNIDKIKEYNKNNKERLDILLKEYRINYRQEHKEKSTKYCRRYYQEHKTERGIYQNNKRRTNLKFNLNHKISGAIYKALKRNKNGYHWEMLIGYTLNDLIKHLKNTMPNGYTWQDYMEGKLHIDHIIPNDAFNYDSAENPDFKRCWALSNLRLLPAKENIIKSNHLSKPFQPALKISFAEGV